METESQVSHTEELRISGKWINVISITGFVLSIILAIMLFISYQNTQVLNNQVISLKDEVAKLQDINKIVNTNQYNAFISTVQHKMESVVITDDLSLNKINIVDKDIIIDVNPQPSLSSKYQGSGKFNMQDREVKAMVVDFLDASKTFYNKLLKLYDGANPMPNWDDETITVTIKNYEIGTFKNGKFYLKGESN